MILSNICLKMHWEPIKKLSFAEHWALLTLTYRTKALVQVRIKSYQPFEPHANATTQSQHKHSYTRGEVCAVQVWKQTLTSIASLSNMRSCRNSSSLILRSWKSSSIWDWASSSCCRTVSMWLIELLWGVLLLEMAESLCKAERGEGEEKRTLLKKPHTIWTL